MFLYFSYIRIKKVTYVCNISNPQVKRFRSYSFRKDGQTNIFASYGLWFKNLEKNWRKVEADPFDPLKYRLLLNSRRLRNFVAIAGSDVAWLWVIATKTQRLRRLSPTLAQKSLGWEARRDKKLIILCDVGKENATRGGRTHARNCPSEFYRRVLVVVADVPRFTRDKNRTFEQLENTPSNDAIIPLTVKIRSCRCDARYATCTGRIAPPLLPLFPSSKRG